MRNYVKVIVSSLTLMILFTGCATFRSGLELKYEGVAKQNTEGGRTSVFFDFSHVQQTIGLDAIPKLGNRHQMVNGLDDIFNDALREFSNVDKYATFTQDASDVNNPARRNERDSLMSAFQYTIRMRIVDQKYFSRLFLGTLASTVTATLAPVAYTEYFSVEVDVLNHDRKVIATYQRRARLTKWVQTFMIFVYPFHPEARKREEVYMEFFHDIFRQIESEGVLK